MPTNLPPEYFEVEKRYREAKTPSEKLRVLEEMLAIVPKHKGTDKLRADLRRRVSRLKSKQQSKKATSRRDEAHRIDREGAGQIVLVGPPNVGKSALVAALTNAAPEVADFPNTTWKPTPGMMPYENIQIQLIDTPPMTREYMEPWLPDMVRRADMILLVVDVTADPVQQLEDTVALLKQKRIAPLRSADLYEGESGWTFKPVLVVANKNDDALTEENVQIFRDLMEDDWPMVAVSATTGRNFDLLKQVLFERLEIIRVYTKARGKAPDHKAPFVLKKGATVEDLAAKIHKEFSEKLKFAKVWGNEVYDGQMIQRDYVLKDGDVVELHV
ncbi:MAG: TGS domain-containing protein [Deltaproteobacteria bacterium]|mgnify:CR=1 FL=1|nr:TGS domain-containing protein [Deltaproteobacteria bacterium]MBW2018452.1 TGS domain-containing protein [Deltaproteobacteria bacterium]MBW2073739.1 TGS domain-containing protein [Deltaproteobacteria bacterium]RLB83611.1 MAG: GTP-binding protein HSR1 [Deltaproteobacteria bacterium]